MQSIDVDEFVEGASDASKVKSILDNVATEQTNQQSVCVVCSRFSVDTYT